MSSLHNPKPLLPWWQLTLLIAGCAFGVWWLMPNDSQLIENLVRDHAYVEATQRLSELSPQDRARKPVYYRTLDIRLARLGLPTDATPEQLAAFWAMGTKAWAETNFPVPLFAELIRAIPRLHDPAAAWNQTMSVSEKIPPIQKKRLAEALSRAAVAANQPRMSAELYQIAHPAAERSISQNLELSRLWQSAGEPQFALDALGRANSPQTTKRRISLLRALNRNGEAFALIRTLIPPGPTMVLTPDTIDQLVATALAAGIPAEVLPYYQKFAADHPDDLAVQKRWRDLLVSAGKNAEALPAAHQVVRLSNNDPSEIRTLAQLAEYSGKPGEAFDAWLKLVHLNGDLYALDRLVQLNPGLYRDRDLALALEVVVPVEGHPDYTLMSARMERELGRYTQARRYFEAYLELKPNDETVTLELAVLHYELFEYVAAEKWYRHACALAPGQVEPQLAVANAVMMQNRPEDAFRLYREIVQNTSNEDAIEHYIRIAESLGRYDEVAEGLKRRLASNPTAEAQDYRRLAYTYARINETDTRIEVLKQGLKHYPDDSGMRVELAQVQTDQKNYRAAEETLRLHPSLHDDLTATLLYLDLLNLNDDQSTERTFLAQPFPDTFENNEEFLIRIARAHMNLGDPDQAESIYRKLHELRPENSEYTLHLSRSALARGRFDEASALLQPLLSKPTPDILQLASEIAVATGNLPLAEKCQLSLIAAKEHPTAYDWGSLAEIRLQRKDPAGARRAYETARQLLIAKLMHPAETQLAPPEILQRVSILPRPEQNYLAYLETKLDQRSLGQAISRQILQQYPEDQPTLLMLASLAIEDKDAPEALRLAQLSVQSHPNDHQGRYYLGAAYFLQKDYARAFEVWSDLKQSQFAAKKYPYEADLASSAYLSGHWSRARQSYEELLHNARLDEENRSEVHRVLQEIKREHARRIEVAAHHIQLDRSGVWRYEATLASHLGERNWLSLTYHRDVVTLKPSPDIRPGSYARDQWEAFASRQFNDHWKAGLHVGAAAHKLMAGAELHYLIVPQRVITLEQTVNDRALDSLLLEALDGREDRTSLRLAWLVNETLAFNVRGYARSVHLDNHRLGEGNGVEINLDQTFKTRDPNISVGYRGSLASFNPRPITPEISALAEPVADPRNGTPARDAIASNLVSSRINRHGAGIQVYDTFDQFWLYRFNAGLDYDFVLSSLGWNANFALSYYLGERIELSGDIGYTSSATNNNAGSAATLSNLVLRYYY